MSDEAQNRCQREGSNHQPLSLPAETPQWFFRMSAPCLSAAWLQPLVPTLVVQPTLRPAVTLNYLPPHTSLLQSPLRRDDPPQIPQSTALHPSIHGWGMTGSVPGPFVGPISSEYCPVEQWHAHLQPAASHQRTKVVIASPDTQKARGTEIVQTGGGQRQDNNMPTLEIPNRTKTASFSLASTQSPSEGPIEIIDLCTVENEGLGTLGAQKPDSTGTVQSGQVMETKILSVSTGEKTGGWKTVKRDLETEKLPPKKRWGKRKMADQASPIQAKIKIHIPDQQTLKPKEKPLNTKVSGSRSKGLQTEKKNMQPKRAQAPKVTTAKNKMQAKLSTEPLKSVPKSNLALRMMESVQVFYPLGKSNVSTMPARKAPPSTSTLPVKPVFTSARPAPKAVPMSVPKPLVNPLASTLTKAMPPTSLPKQPPFSLAKPSLIPVLVPQPVPRVKPQPTSVKKSLPNVVGRTSTLESRQGISRQQNQRPSHSQAKETISTIFNFRPRTLPRDHGLVLKYHHPPPILPFELAFRNWKPPPKHLEVSTPITEEQRPRREMMKRQAQKEREEAARWTSLGRVQFFVEREKEKVTSVMFGYP